MEKINKSLLESFVNSINEQTKEKYELYQTNGGYNLVMRTPTGGITDGSFGTLSCLDTREMYYYLRGLMSAITSIRYNGVRNTLKRKN